MRGAPLIMTADDLMDTGQNSLGESNKPEPVEAEVEFPRIRKYDDQHKGPFVVNIRAGKNGLSHMKVSKYLFATYKNSISRVTQVNKHKIQVLFSSAVKANELPLDDNEVLKQHRVYIPAELVEIDGLVFISPEDSTEDLMENAVGKFDYLGVAEVPVIDVFRFQVPPKSNQEQAAVTTSTNKTPSSLVRVTFPGTVLPNKLAINGLLLPVKPYKRQVMFCSNCLRTGHTAKYCVVNPRCIKCGEAHLVKECKSTNAEVKCFLCGGGHDVNNQKLCPKIAVANTKYQLKN